MALAFLAGAVAALSAAALAARHLPPEPVRLPPPDIRVYDCANIGHAPPPGAFAADHAARYALARLQTACETQDAALALAKIWAENPAAGEVLETEEGR